jgi:ParB family chromosome partitioning protein
MAAGLDKIPAVVRDIGDDKMLQLALLENIQREDLNAIERAKGYQRLIRDLGWTQEQAAERLGESRTSLANTLRLLELPEEIQQIVSRETISPGHARCLLVLRDPEAQKRLCQRIIKESLSVREVEDIVSGDRHQTAASRQAQRSAPHIRDIEERLQRVLGTKVQVRERGQRGRIIINFANHDDFERILAMIDREGGAGGFHV